LSRLLNGKYFHYLKVAQHALVYSHKNSNKLLNTFWDKPLWYIKLYFKIKSLIKKRYNVPQFKGKEIMIHIPSKIVMDDNNQPHSQFFDWVNDTQNKVFVVSNKSPLKYHSTIDLKELYQLSNYYKLNNFTKDILNEIIGILSELKKSDVISKKDYSYLKSSFYLFFDYLMFYDFVLSNFPDLQKMIFITHYHKEALIACCLNRGIKTIELQHGLISKNDIYYVYPDYIKRL
jgi:hypothetical protein